MAKRIKRYNNKLYDFGTANVSFLQLAHDLQYLGVKEWYFLLEIKDHSIAGVDPYQCDNDGNTTLTKDQISRIIRECTRNMWYFLREVCRIPAEGNPNGVPYKANRGNIAQAYLIYNGIDSWLCLPRQQGKTQSALAAQNWAFNFGTSNSTFIFVNKDGDNAKENLKRLITQINLLPSYMHFEYTIDYETGKTVKAKRNATRIDHPVTKNTIITKAKATSRDNAISLARGLTAPIIHYDEPEFTNHIGEIVSNSVSTYNTAAQNSRASGSMYGRIFTCTPGDLDTQMGIEAQEILNHTIRWNDTMYNLSKEELEAKIRQDKTSNHIIYIEYHYYQIGLTREWMESICAEIGNKITARREILLQRIHGSSLSPYDQTDLEYINDCRREPIEYIYLLDYFVLDVYEKLDPTIPYIVGIDCSTGTVNDNNAITVLNPYTIEPVAEFSCSYIGETMYEKLIMDLVTNHIPRAIVAIERNSVGDGIIDHLLQSKISSRLYFDKSRDLLEDKIHSQETVESMLKKQASVKSYYGVYTSAQSREDMFSLLSKHVKEYKEKFITRNIIHDLSGLVIVRGNKIAAGPGFHDDSIMSYLIALYVYYYGNNLAAFGFEKYKPDENKFHQGLPRYSEERLKNVLPEKEADAVVKRQKAEAELDYESILRDAIAKSQEENKRLAQSHLNVHTGIDEDSSGFVPDDDIVDLSIFDTLNGFNV